MIKQTTKNQNRHFGVYGGRYVPEMLIPALEELEEVYFSYGRTKKFKSELNALFKHYSGRPTPLYFAKRMTENIGGANIYLKLESLNHTGAHKINNVLGQMLLCKYMGKKYVIAETGAGQHGVATATVAAKMGFKCLVFMGEVDIKRQYPNVFLMKRLGAEVIPVKEGTKTLKDAVNCALKYWIENLEDHHYLIGSALGPYPYPEIVRDFQSIIGEEIKSQFKNFVKENNLPKAYPDVLLACVGGGSNAMGMFYPFIDKNEIELIGVEAGGRGINLGENASRMSLNLANVGIAQGYKSYFLQSKDGQIAKTHSISAGLDYAGIGPELSYLFEKKRISFVHVSDKDAIDSVDFLAKNEGIIPALESSHAVSYGISKAKKMKKNQSIIINISGRGDKDIFIMAPKFDKENWLSFLKSEISILEKK